MGNLIVKEGGFWNQTEATNPGKLLTIQLFGVQGTGLGAVAAINSWLQRAMDALQSEFSDTQ